MYKEYSAMTNEEKQKVDAELGVLENDFLAGRLDQLKGRECPVCGQKGVLMHSVYKELFNADAPPGRRYKSGISIYCLGACNSMISHLDGFCPAWAEGIEDWEKFTQEHALRQRYVRDQGSDAVAGGT